MFWKNTLDDVVTPLEEIDSDRIVGISCDFNNVNPLFTLCVYLPSSNHDIEEFNEYLDYLWALYDSLFTKGFVIVIGDLNINFGNALGDRGFYEPNNRGLKLLDFANYFNLCPNNLCRFAVDLSRRLFHIAEDLNKRFIIFYCQTVCPTVFIL